MRLSSGWWYLGKYDRYLFQISSMKWLVGILPSLLSSSCLQGNSKNWDGCLRPSVQLGRTDYQLSMACSPLGYYTRNGSFLCLKGHFILYLFDSSLACTLTITAANNICHLVHTDLSLLYALRNSTLATATRSWSLLMRLTMATVASAHAGPIDGCASLALFTCEFPMVCSVWPV